MRIALVTPYSWTYAGGVNRHVEAIARELDRRGHELRVLAPWDPPDRLSTALHRRPAEPRRRPDYLVPLGRTVGIPMNGAVSNLSTFPEGVTALRRELRAFAPDVVHVHEPVAPVVGWDACSYREAPVVGTFHAYSTKAAPNHYVSLLGARRKFNQLSARIAVSQAAAWTGRRWFGGSYHVIPNGVDVEAASREPKLRSDELRVLFVGRPEERKGLPVLLAAFEALIEHVPARLRVIGAGPADVERHLADPAARQHVEALGSLEGDQLWRHLHEADVLCAPSLAGESFGMVLIEAFAAGTPVVASNIAGYADVVSDDLDGALVPPGDPQRLAEELQRLHHQPELRERMSVAARASAKRFAWPRVAAEVENVYESVRCQTVPAASSARGVARRTGLVPADGGPRRPAARLEALDPDPARAGAGRGRAAKRIGLATAGVVGVGLTALAAAQIGLDQVMQSIVRSDSNWVLLATALMAASMLMRAASWFLIARAALPATALRRRDVASATMVGVLMSATLPARLGEPARAVVLARRTGRVREALPVLLGTLVSQTALNILALVGLGILIVGSTDLFAASSERLFLVSTAPLLLVVAILLAPLMVRQEGSGRPARVMRSLREALLRVRSGLRVFRDPRRGPAAAGSQFAAWSLQLAACYVLFAALGLEQGIGAAAAVLFAVNVTSVVPATPSNVGVFQLAVISVLTTGFDVGAADALAYGVILQAVEIATAVALGLPALVREGVSWQDMRLRALNAAPVRLAPWRERTPEGLST